jgi:N-acylneuraminate cytidylyltransferase
MEVVTVIPARGGSKSVPRKNLQIVNGKTLVERAILSALRIPFNQIYVSSDDSEVLEIAQRLGVTAVERSEINSTDEATSESVILETLSMVAVRTNIITLLQPTSPFIDIQSWSSALDNMRINQDIHSMFAAVEKNEFLWELSDDKWKPVNHDKALRLPRQKRLRTVIEAGSFYIFRRELFEKEKTRFCGNSQPAITRNWSSFDIDTIEDLDLCRELSVIFDSKRF